VCEEVSEKRDKSQRRYAWCMQPEATGRHRNQRLVEQMPQSNKMADQVSLGRAVQGGDVEE